ncbi:peptidoglycan editing factor PgeF [Histophilus somni]|uniref:Purine nucleoside phosphorylase n=1 Tax=Histophilus somni TaxID=731 RepID=A0AAX2RZV3_HISSO|nr:peptidoglycan editing factor PgeF [Histophilus somni]QEH13087.1 peptidoglycan editing factor PgeF [Histophilus somni]QEH24602.1 peptidoglycan editing factor PgeF [Histophilus somni]QEH27570.1 peptidoglycan editing factor PgeF [Histophilus somni]QEH51773.1 peptidoglycan editing factor PgeF [Histophilus somni]
MQIIKANLGQVANVQGLMTTRQGGISVAPYDSLNLGDHVGDDESAVKINRTLLVKELGLPQDPIFLNQTHSTKVLRLPYQEGMDLNADAVYSDQANQVCLVMTADCLPVLFTNRQGNEVAAAHAGWRGLCDGILEETVKQFRVPKEDIIAWLGVAIGPKFFQVGKEVVEQFIAKDPQAKNAFTPDREQENKFLGNLYQIAKQRLNALGITEIYGGEHCTYSDKERFFSYRRDGKTGRLASLIWFSK